VPRPALEVADIFRDYGAAWRQANAGHVSLGQLKVMSAIESCRTAALGGHVARCENCPHTVIAYNSCRRHCPKCQGAAAKQWLAEREADLLRISSCWMSAANTSTDRERLPISATIFQRTSFEFAHCSVASGGAASSQRT
jgi:hypothetical protein